MIFRITSFWKAVGIFSFGVGLIGSKMNEFFSTNLFSLEGARGWTSHQDKIYFQFFHKRLLLNDTVIPPPNPLKGEKVRAKNTFILAPINPALKGEKCVPETRFIFKSITSSPKREKVRTTELNGGKEKRSFILLKTKFRFLFLAVLFCFFMGKPNQAIAQTDTLIVGVHVNPPFIILSANETFEGLSIELWENIAKANNWNFRYRKYSDLIGILKALEYQEIDLTINPMDVNDIRVKKFEVTQPYFISSIGVAAPYVSNYPFLSFIKNIFSFDFLKIVLLLAFVIFVFGFFLWLAERNKNKFQFRPGILGLFDGLWWSAVTMTTVGYGDKAPKTNLGKAIAIIWMFTAVIIISSFTASIASTLTIGSLQAEIENSSDIELLDAVSTVGASNGEEYLNQENISISNSYASPILALRALAKNENDVLLYDKTVLQYYINRLDLNEKVKLLPINLQEHYQSFMMPKGHPIFEQINIDLVKEIQKESWKGLQQQYNVEEW